ncbi:hypothetical protein [Aureimonas sp. AU4]|uniref:hypothetical protein n=1 Tax=Aureimonas sp. AU4 TaxID=1638163 RepID=UPI000785FD79|nr:hypothetical protein [Aureimonas sp. AU4]
MSPVLPRACALLAILTLLSGCRSDVLPAVFGLGEGGIAAYAPGTLPVIVAHPGDRLIGQSANEAGRCIYANAAGRRFRADCPDGYKP